MRNQIYTKNTEYIACSQNLSKNLHFRKTFVYLSDVAKSAPLLWLRRIGDFATSVRRITSADVARRYANFAHL